MSNPGPALGLGIGDILSSVSKLRHNPPKEGGGIVQRFHHGNKALIVKTEAGKLTDLIHGRHFSNQLIVQAPKGVHDF